jgi:hypothetical protein
MQQAWRQGAGQGRSFEEKMGYGIPDDERGPDTPETAWYQDVENRRRALLATHAQQQQLASRHFADAGLASNMAGAQMRGQALTPAIGAAGAGDALQARQALYGGGQASWQAGAEAARMGSQDRLASAQGAMGVEAMRARYEQAAREAELERLGAYRGSEYQQRIAEMNREKERDERISQLIGAGIGAGGAAMSGF